MTLPLAGVLLSTLAPALLAPSPADSTGTRPNPGSGAPIVASAPALPPAPMADSTLALLASVESAASTLGATAPTTAAPAPAAAPAAAPAPAAPAPATSATAAVTPMPISVAANGRRYFGTVDSLRVEKAAHRLTLFRGGIPVVSYSIALGQNPVGHKERAGDRRTPEGLYYIDGRNPKSRFHLGLHVSYPNAADLARARRLGVPAGGDIMIHGLPNGQGSVGAAHRQYDWTNGCVALTNEEMEELWQSVPVGTPIRILP